MIRRLFFVLFCLCTVIVNAQQKSIRGKVINFLDDRQENIEILIVELNKKTLSDTSGNFFFSDLPEGVFTLIAFYDGYSFPPVQVDLQTEQTAEVTIKIGSQEYDLDEVRIQTRTRAEQLKTSAIKAEVVSIEEESQRANSVEELINRAPGVKIRNVGGLGSNSNILVGGFTGNSIKFLYDDIPMDYLGSNYGLTKVPTNTIGRIEIYKGVLPAKLGVDALGSAINIVPKTYNRTSGTLSYETGSFRTHIGTVNATVKIKEHLFFGTNSFYNYSKNDYKVNRLPYKDPQTGRTTYIREKLFHNTFEQRSLELFVQGRGLTWADWIELKINSYDIQKDIQNDSYSRARPFGEVYRRERGNFIPSLKYKKYFLDNKLNVNQFLVYSRINFELFDPAKNVYYDWKGERHGTVSGSEMGNLLMPNGYMSSYLDQITSRTNLNYLLNNNFQ